MASTIQIRVEDELKSKSDALFKDLGTDTTTAIRNNNQNEAKKLFSEIKEEFKKAKNSSTKSD